MTSDNTTDTGRSKTTEPEEAFASPLTPFGFLRYAAGQSPILKWAIGVGGIAAIVAIVTQWHLPPTALIFGSIAIFVGMFGIYIFSLLVHPPPTNIERPPLIAMVALWCFAFILIVSSGLTTSSLFFDWPVGLRELVVGPSSLKPPTKWVSVSQFYIDDRFDQPIGLRHWTRLPDKSWIERYPDGRISSSKEGQRIKVGEIWGTVVESNDDPSLEVFIPNMHFGKMNVLFRRDGQDWKQFGEMLDVK